MRCSRSCGTPVRFPTSSAWVGTWIKLASGLDVPVDKKLLKTLQEMGNVVGLGALAVADRSASPAPMQPPSITGHRHVDWVPMPVPGARREVELQLAGVGVAALLSAEKQTPDGGAQRDSLHKTNGDGFHLPLVLGRNAADEESLPPPAPGTGSTRRPAGERRHDPLRRRAAGRLRPLVRLGGGGQPARAAPAAAAAGVPRDVLAAGQPGGQWRHRCA